MYKIGSQGESDAGKSEALLKKMGIALRDISGEFRTAHDVLSELSGQWETMTKVSKTNVAQTVAGIDECLSIQ